MSTIYHSRHELLVWNTQGIVRPAEGFTSILHGFAVAAFHNFGYRGLRQEFGRNDRGPITAHRQAGHNG